jgi:N-acetylneuraminic acid mutarotase
VSVWTGRELVVWGGNAFSFYDSHSVFGDGAAYDPATDRWRTIAASPLSARWGAAGGWTGTRMVVWSGAGAGGSTYADGAAYDPASDAWSPIAASPLAGRVDATAIWTGHELLIFGGSPIPGGTTAPTDGARYDPATNTWRPMAASPLAARAGAVVAWTGREVLVWGGTRSWVPFARFDDGVAYDPATDTWRALATAPLSPRGRAAGVWTGRELVVAGGDTEDVADARSAAAYDPATNAWRTLPSLPVDLGGVRGVWTRSEVVVWGGPFTSSDGQAVAFDPRTSRWRILPRFAEEFRTGESLVWTGRDVVIWGGVSGGGKNARYHRDGSRYRPT